MSGLQVFYFILAGQSLSLLGTSLTNFGLGVWAFQTGESVTNFTLIAIVSTLPGILFGPIIGSLVDRTNRKKLLFLAQLGSALVTLALAVLYWSGLLQVWHIIALVPFASICGMMLFTGFTSTVVLMVPSERLSKANGAVSLVFGVVQLSGPLLAGIAMDQIGIEGIFVIDIVSFLIGLFTLAIAVIPNPTRIETAEKTGLIAEAVEAFHYLRSKPGVLGGLYLFTVIWFNVSAVQVLMLPLILSFSSTTELGMVQSMGGLGALAGGITMMTWQGPKRKMFGILGAALFVAMVLIILPIAQEIVWIAGCSFLIMAAAPIASVSSQTLWQNKVAVQYHGRAFSLRNTIMRAAQPAAFLSAGLLADHIFEPAMAGNTWLSNIMGPLFGTGEGRGVALMISLFGVLSFLMVLFAVSQRHIREVDIALPDEGKSTT